VISLAHLPNFHLEHVLGYEAEVHLSPTLVTNAKRGLSTAQIIICDRFRKQAYANWLAKRSGPEPALMFKWDDVTVERIPGSLPEIHVTGTPAPVVEASAPTSPSVVVGAGDCACVCQHCEIGAHCLNWEWGCKKEPVA